MKIRCFIPAILTIAAALSQLASAEEKLQLENEFNVDEIKWIKTTGTSTVEGTASIRLADGTVKGCAGFNVEILPASYYSDERIFKIYGSNSSGKILMENHPPKFTPDPQEYHDLLLKTQCDKNNRFIFENVPAGRFYVIALVIWKKDGVDTGGGVMMQASIKNDERKFMEIKL